jgi:hypothetical protein
MRMKNKVGEKEQQMWMEKSVGDQAGAEMVMGRVFASAGEEPTNSHPS